MRYLKKYNDLISRFFSTNEELEPESYISAANALKSLGHKRRPADLEEWSDIMRLRKLDVRKSIFLSESKKLGQFRFRFSKSSENFYGHYYPYFEINYDALRIAREDYLDSETSRFDLPIFMGLIPVSNDDRQVLVQSKSVEESNNGIYYVQDMYINLSIGSFSEVIPRGTSFLDHLNKENAKNKVNPLNFGEIIPSGTLSIESGIGSEVYLGNRSDAIKFKKMLIDLFEGNCDYNIEVSGVFKPFYSEIIEQLCESDNEPISPEEYQRFLDSIRFIAINSLYRD